ncbi:hypothetical protein BSKO_06473 [Bryopsis sp. KO-2023]|nr:hypothetical protein BSKO_06473 [Bryopsis sp. KO-2023]
MAKSARSNRGKRVKASRRILLENQPSWVKDAKQKRQDAMAENLNAAKIEPVYEKKTKLLMRKREERRAQRKGIVQSSLSELNDMAISAMESGAADTEAKPVVLSEDQKKIAFLRAELGRLRKQVSKRKYRGRDSMFQGERRSRIKEIVQILKKADPAPCAEEPALLKSKRARKEKRDPLAVKSGGVTKVRGAVPEPREHLDDREDMEEDSDGNEAEVAENQEGKESEQPPKKDPNAFDGGVALRRRNKLGRIKKARHAPVGSDWLRKTKKGNPYHKYAGKTLRQKRRFEFKGIYQFYPKPQAPAAATDKKD